ncbi:hypothetical protein [Microbulbifer sp. TB1203]|uniref:hypothetical protein n=1 Tax=Microbulbifer sp. TB1203 TaxID=3021712 RepID=UPI0027E4D293|nr:hypothetical protein [Microbulbifer sp. TB1203]
MTKTSRRITIKNKNKAEDNKNNDKRVYKLTDCTWERVFARRQIERREAAAFIPNNNNSLLYFL